MGKDLRLLLLGGAHSLNHSLFVVAPPLLTLIMADLNVSKHVMGTVSTIASFIYGFGALVGGPLGDKIGEAKTTLFFLLFSGFSTFLMLVAKEISSINVFATSLILMAVGASLYHPTANSLISKTFKGRVSEAMGIHGVGGTLGVVLTPSIAWFIGSAFGWPSAFIIFGVLCVAFGLLFARNFKLESVKRKHKSSGNIVEAFKVPEIWILLVFNMTIGLFTKGVELFFPTFFEENRFIHPMWASIAYTAILTFGVFGQWIGGKSADKFGCKKTVIVATLGTCIALLSLLLLPVYIVGIAIFIAFYGFFFYAHQPALNALVGFLSPEGQRGTIYGIFFFSSFGLGSISQFTSGYLADMYGLDSAFYVLTIFSIVALLLSIKLPEKGRISQK
ncbi:MAG: MFS transporter [Candidatus Bathyarchaeia archaeon]